MTEEKIQAWISVFAIPVFFVMGLYTAWVLIRTHGRAVIPEAFWRHSPVITCVSLLLVLLYFSYNLQKILK